MRKKAYSFWELLQRNVPRNTSPCWLWTWCMCALVTAIGQRVSWWAIWKLLHLSLSFRKKDSSGWEKQNYIESISTALEGSVHSFLQTSAPVPERKCEKVEWAHHLHALLKCLREETQRMATWHQSHQRKSSSHGQSAAYESHGAVNMAQHKIITLLKISWGGDIFSLSAYWSSSWVWTLWMAALCHRVKGLEHPQGLLTLRKSPQLERKIWCQVFDRCELLYQCFQYF